MHYYTARITMECPLFQVEPFVSALPRLGELNITSKQFDTYDECVNQATGLLNALHTLLKQVDNERYVITSKTSAEEEDERWDANTSLRMYVANAKRLKKKELLFHISANINSVQVTSHVEPS